MTRPTALIVGVFLLLLFPLTLLADSDVEKLISQTGIKEGSVSVRDISRWREPRKIVVRAPDELVGELRRLWPDVERRPRPLNKLMVRKRLLASVARTCWMLPLMRAGSRFSVPGSNAA